MSKFAKLIELEDGEQVLLTLNYNDEDDNYEVKVRTDLNGATASIKLGFNEEDKALELLEKYTKKDATKYREQMVEMLG
jgi:hypothetical protein